MPRRAARRGADHQRPQPVHRQAFPARLGLDRKPAEIHPRRQIGNHRIGRAVGIEVCVETRNAAIRRLAEERHRFDQGCEGRALHVGPSQDLGKEPNQLTRSQDRSPASRPRI